jgi:transposase
MSLHPQPIPLGPEETARVARTAFPHGNLYLMMRDELGTRFTDDDCAALFPTRGQPAAAPWRLARVTIMPYGEEVSDRQAAEAVRGRIDGKYALS